MTPHIQIRSKEFYEACEQWCQNGLNLLRTKVADGLEIPPVPRLGFEVQRDPSGGSFREIKQEERSIEPLVNQKFYREMLELPAFLRLTEVMGRTEQIARHLDTHVGTQYGTHMIRARWLLNKLLINFWKEAQKLEFEGGVFDRVYLRLESFLFSKNLSVEVTVPLDGFESKVASIELGEGLAIRRLPDQDLQRMYATDHWFRNLYKDRLLDVPQYAIILQTEKEKIFGFHAFDDGDIMQIIHDVISVLRVYKTGFVWRQRVHIAAGPEEWGCFPCGTVEPRRIASGKKYSLDEKEVPYLQEFWREYVSVDWKLHAFLGVGVDRLNLGIERERPQDKIIDYVVALEALLLSYMGNRDVGELRFRFALRGAKLFGQGPENRSEVYRELKKVYDVRSQIVHGLSKLDLPSGGECKARPMDDFVNTVEEYARRALLKFLDLAKNGKKGQLIDWDSLVLN